MATAGVGVEVTVIGGGMTGAPLCPVPELPDGGVMAFVGLKNAAVILD